VKASDLVVRALEAEGVRYVFAVPGEENLDVLESLRTSDVQLEVTRHEQAAGFMAATYGRLTCIPGVALSTLGRGATIFVTAAAYAQLGAMPMVMITGQKPIRTSKQGAFQIIDVVRMMGPITKYTRQVVGPGYIPARLREGRPFSELRGLLPWPTNGRVRQGFGDSRAGGRMRWRGLLIEASEGSDVQAVSHGRVAYAGWLQHYGLVMVLDHGEGYLSLYGHNRSLYREVGDWVNPGEIIGSVGDSGGRDRSGLYFEIRRGSDPVDPVAWLNRR
jgi:murein DD-endopeptidase MepM/ murein hydrolase activator NlpD